jgi:hypothetical protein
MAQEVECLPSKGGALSSGLPKIKKKKERKNICKAGHRSLMPLILATWEAEIRRIAIQGQHRQIVHETPSPK